MRSPIELCRAAVGGTLPSGLREGGRDGAVVDGPRPRARAAPSIKEMKAAIVAGGVCRGGTSWKWDVVERYRQALSKERPEAPKEAAPAPAPASTRNRSASVAIAERTRRTTGAHGHDGRGASF